MGHVEMFNRLNILLDLYLKIAVFDFWAAWGHMKWGLQTWGLHLTGVSPIPALCRPASPHCTQPCSPLPDVWPPHPPSHTHHASSPPLSMSNPPSPTSLPHCTHHAGSPPTAHYTSNLAPSFDKSMKPTAWPIPAAHTHTPPPLP